MLVLDDDIDMRDLIGMILEDAGARVTAVDGVQAALAAMASRRPDVAVSDLAMPGEDGYAFARHVRSTERETGCRVALV